MNINVEGSIIIKKDLKTVFDFIANLENDKKWRKEINSTTMTGKPGINVLAKEDSFLSKRTPNHILNLVCTVYDEHKKVVYETLPDSAFYLNSDRQVLLITAQETQVVYNLTFDKSIVKQALGFSLPTFIVKSVAKADMKKYLTQLKTVIEKNS